jgi:hypothetical protein
MSALTRPRGPLPPRVYWTRRLLLLSVAVVLVVGIAQVLGRGSDGKEPDPRAQVVAGTPTPSTTPEASPTRRQRDKKPKKPRPTATPLAQPSGPCLDSDVVVTPQVTKASAGGDVAISLLVTSKLSEACTFEVSPRTVVLKLASGDDRIWSSQECPRAVPEVSVVARRTVPGTAVVTWNGQRSNEGCTQAAGWALPGYYHAEAAALGSEATDVQFLLGPAEARTITPKPKVKKPRSNG